MHTPGSMGSKVIASVVARRARANDNFRFTCLTLTADPPGPPICQPPMGFSTYGKGKELLATGIMAASRSLPKRPRPLWLLAQPRGPVQLFSTLVGILATKRLRTGVDYNPDSATTLFAAPSRTRTA